LRTTVVGHALELAWANLHACTRSGTEAERDVFIERTCPWVASQASQQLNSCNPIDDTTNQTVGIAEESSNGRMVALAADL
jgi:hypothetical protein